MPPDPPRRYAGTIPALAGFLAALAFAGLTALPVLFVAAWGGSHCEPRPSCQRQSEAFLWVGLAVVAGLSALLGFAVRAILRWRMQHRLDPRIAGRRPTWAVVAVMVLGAVPLWVGGQMFLF